MLIALLVIFLILSFAMSIWAIVIIFKRSILGGVLTLVLGIPMLYYLVVGWGKEEGDIRKPFFLSIVFYLMALGAGFKLVSSASDEMKQQLEQQAAPAPRRAPLFPEPAPTPAAAPRARDTAPPAEIVRVREAPAAAQPAAAPRATAPQRPAPVREEPRRPQAAQSNCVYKPVMTDEDLAKCR
jgi:hypothetical protein